MNKKKIVRNVVGPEKVNHNQISGTLNYTRVKEGYKKNEHHRRRVKCDKIRRASKKAKEGSIRDLHVNEQQPMQY